MTAQITSSEIEALVRATKEANQAKVIDLTDGNENMLESVPVLLRPTTSGVVAESIKRFVDEWRQEPERRNGTARVTTLQSFCDHVNTTAAATGARASATTAASTSSRSPRSGRLGAITPARP